MIRYYIHLFFDAGLRFWLDYLRSSELRKSYTASLDYQLEFYFIDSYKYHRQNGDSIRVSSLLAECDWTGLVTDGSKELILEHCLAKLKSFSL